MLPKILAGVLAAVAVSVTGVYFAYPDSPKCDRANESADATQTHDCCSLKPANTSKAKPVAHACCGEDDSVPAESLAAFAGAMTVAVSDKTCAK
jgi:hypothetical protein